VAPTGDTLRRRLCQELVEAFGVSNLDREYAGGALGAFLDVELVEDCKFGADEFPHMRVQRGPVLPPVSLDRLTSHRCLR
jgi:hypothetical protein